MKLSRAALVAAIAVACFLLGSVWGGRRGSLAGAPTDGAHRILYWHDPMHPAYRSDKPGIAPDCGMKLEPVYADSPAGPAGDERALPAAAVQLTPDQQQLIGVRLGTAAKAPGTYLIRTIGRIAADEARVRRISAGVDGWIRTVESPAVGNLVRKDQPLATFYSRDMLTPQQGYIYALETMERVTGDKMPEGLRAADEKTLELARGQLRQAEDALEALGMDRVQMAQLARSRQTAPEVVLRAPVAGYVVERNAAPGQRFEKFTELYRIVDLGHVWIIADLYERDAGRVSTGQAVRVTAENGKALEAHVSSAPPQYDPGSRAFRVRLEADNPDGELRPEMLVDVELRVDLPPGLSIPAEALLDSGTKKTVFVARGNGYYEPRAVQVGWRTSDRVQIVDGLADGDQIALSGQFLLDADSRLRSPPGAVAASPKVIDPTCGMAIDPAAASSSVEYQGRRYYFCSESCRHTFDADPAGTLARPH